MKTDYFHPQIKSRPPFRILRKVIGDRVPWRAIIDKSMKLRPNSWIIIERAHANRHLRSVRPITAEQTGAAVDTERLYRALALSVNLDQLFALQQAELFALDTCLRAYCSPGMLAAAIAMTMAGLKERRIHFKAHAAAQTTAANRPVIRHRLTNGCARQQRRRYSLQNVSPSALAPSAFELRDYAAAHSSLTNRVNAVQRGRLHRRLD
jgi:hypothetical protein